MGTTYYCDPAATGTNDGSSWTNAWADFQTAADTAVAGDIVYCRGTQTLSAVIDLDQHSGTAGGLFIRYVGCDASGTARAGQFSLDGHSAIAHCINSSTKNQLFENFTFKRATGTAYDRSAYNDPTFVRCVFENNGGDAVNIYATGGTFIQSIFRNNSGAAIPNTYGFSSILFCWCYNNTGGGFMTHSQSTGTQAVIGCCIAQNGQYQLRMAGGCVVMNVVDGKGNSTGEHGIYGSYGMPIIGNRITYVNAADKYGIAVDGSYQDYNVFYGNTGDTSAAVTSGVNSVVGATDGYVDRANLDYNIAVGAELRSQALDLNFA